MTEKSQKKKKSSKSGDADVDRDALTLPVKRTASTKKTKGKDAKGGIQKKSRAPKESEKSTKKRSGKSQPAESAKPARSNGKKKKKRSQEDESSSEDEEAGEEAEVGDDVVAEEVDEREEVSDDEDDSDGKGSKTPEEIEAAKAHRKSQVRAKARTRGYRSVAREAGYSAKYSSSASHLDVSRPVLSDAETIRACQWAPQLADKPAYAGLEEFEERTQLSLESLPKSAAKVIRQSGEAYLRRLSLGAMQRASDAQKARVTATMVQAETRPLQRVQKYSFVAPHGLVRFSQGYDHANYRIQKLDEDVEQMGAEKKGLLKDQQKKQDAMFAEKPKKKKAVQEDDAATGNSIAKKRTKRASAN